MSHNVGVALTQLDFITSPVHGSRGVRGTVRVKGSLFPYTLLAAVAFLALVLYLSGQQSGMPVGFARRL